MIQQSPLGLEKSYVATPLQSSCNSSNKVRIKTSMFSFIGDSFPDIRMHNWMKIF